MSEIHKIDQLSERINVMERQNKRLKGGLLALVMIAFFAIPFISLHADGDKTASFDTVTAKKFAVMDKKGDVRIIMSADKRRTTVGLLGAGGKVRIAMALDGKGNPILSLNGGDEKPRVTVTSSKKNGPSVILFNEGGKADAVLMSNKKGGGGAIMMLKGKDGKVIKTYK